jgi:hypothetical protein
MSPVASTAYKHLRLYPNIAKAVRRAWRRFVQARNIVYGGNGLNPEVCKWVRFNDLPEAPSPVSTALKVISVKLAVLRTICPHLITLVQFSGLDTAVFLGRLHHSGSWKTWLGAIFNFRRPVDISERCHVRKAQQHHCKPSLHWSTLC